MKSCVLGNPINSISSIKFLDKFLRIASSFSDEVLVINDGFPRKPQNNVSVAAATEFSRKISLRGNGIFFSMSKFIAAQLGFCKAILRNHRRIDIAFLFPISMFLPIVLLKALGKRTILYEAQDVWSEGCHKGIMAQLRFSILLITRAIVLRIIDHIIVEGEISISANKIEKYRNIISVLPQFVDLEWYRPQTEITQREEVITFVGGLDYRKGILEFSKAVKMIENTRLSIKAYIIGKGPYLNRVQSELSWMVSQKRAFVLPYVSEERFRNILNETKILVLPSKAEGMPNIILESMASGAIVLATRVGVIPEVIKDDETGFLLEDGTAEAIKDRIEYILEYQNHEEIVSNALSFVKFHYSFESALRRYRLMLRSIL